MISIRGVTRLRLVRRVCVVAIVTSLTVALWLTGDPAGAQETDPDPDPSTEQTVPPVTLPEDFEPIGEGDGDPLVEVPAVEEPDSVSVSINSDSPGISQAVLIVLLLTIGAVAPAILLLMTSFTRFAVVLSLTRNAVGSQQVPPNQVLVGLALFLTFFVMAPALSQINEQALQPLLQGEIDQSEAFERGFEPLRAFMLAQTGEDDLELFTDLADEERPATPEDVPATTLIPAFVISELRTAFTIGFVIFIPFLVIDLVVASVLMSMGMMMLPPVFISLPLKLLLFVLVDGWSLIVGSVVSSVNGVT